MNLDPNRFVGFESRKAYRRRCETGFWDAFVAGPKILDIGYKGGEEGVMPILPGSVGVELNRVSCNGTILSVSGDHYIANMENESVDTIHCSHMLEHVSPPRQYIQQWWRLLRVGGTLIIMVPHAFLYERQVKMPSRWSPEHLRWYTPATLLAEIEAYLPPNSYRVAHLADVDDGYDYSLPVDVHPRGCLEIELVLRKIQPPSWSVER